MYIGEQVSVSESPIEGRLRTVLAENLNRHPVTKVAVGIGILVFICFAVPMGAMHLAQAVNPEETLNQQIQEVSMSQSIPNEDRSDETIKPSQTDKNIEICTQNLVAIGKAIETYKKEHGDFPDWLSDLHPKHLADANALICPYVYSVLLIAKSTINRPNNWSRHNGRPS